MSEPLHKPVPEEVANFDSLDFFRIRGGGILKRLEGV